MRGWREFYRPTTERSKAKPIQSRITFDTQLKITLTVCNPGFGFAFQPLSLSSDEDDDDELAVTAVKTGKASVDSDAESDKSDVQATRALIQKLSPAKPTKTAQSKVSEISLTIEKTTRLLNLSTNIAKLEHMPSPLQDSYFHVIFHDLNYLVT